MFCLLGLASGVILVGWWAVDWWNEKAEVDRFAGEHCENKVISQWQEAIDQWVWGAPHKIHLDSRRLGWKETDELGQDYHTAQINYSILGTKRTLYGRVTHEDCQLYDVADTW